MAVRKEENPLFFKHSPLLAGTTEGKARGERTVGKHDAMARHAASHAGTSVHGVANLPRAARSAHEASDLPVACYAPLRDLTYDIPSAFEE